MSNPHRLLSWEVSREPGDMGGGGPGRHRQVLMRTVVPSRVLGLEILADLGYLHQEGET